MKNFIIFFFLICISSSYGEIPKERRLKKLSMHLRGINPSANEYEAVSKIAKDDLVDFFYDKTKEYLGSDEHVKKMNLRLNQLFRLSPSSYYSENYLREEQNSLNYLFKEIVRDNLSWDLLLTGKKYKMSQASESFTMSDFGFLGSVLPEGSPKRVRRGIINQSKDVLEDIVETGEDGYVYRSTKEFSADHTFSAGDPRIAGALTTERFFGRYTNTAINKNRKRAAAVFRIFLCDDMEAAITDSANRTDYILDFVFPDTAGMSAADVSNISLGDSAHGNRPDCMACHYKLDPLGKNFGGSAISLAPTAFSGGLVFKSSTGEKVSIKTNGLGDLAEQIINQPDYKSCQTKQFWTWFIGEDEYLTPDVHEELNAKFDEFDGKVNDFISYLVNRKEFYMTSSLSEEAKLAFKVKKTLRNCNQCHDNEGLPSFTTWPIENEHGDMKYWTGKILKSLGGGNQTRSMPPESHIWQPSENEIKEINKWIEIGAPNEQGNVQIN